MCSVVLGVGLKGLSALTTTHNLCKALCRVNTLLAIKKLKIITEERTITERAVLRHRREIS